MRAKKSLGQNFLQDACVITRIVSLLDLMHEDTVIEIGPGEGALTEGLIESGARVIAIEFDRDLIDHLRRRFRDRDNFQLISQDALTTDFSLFVDPPKKLKLAANLPYNISTPILQRLIVQRALFAQIVLMFQREVAERIAAPAGSSARGSLSVMVENAFDIERMFDVPPTAFRPVPKVWSSVVRLMPKESVIADEENLRKLLIDSFAQKRKTILNNLKPVVANAQEVLETAEINEKRRAESLTLEDWQRLLTEIVRDR